MIDLSYLLGRECCISFHSPPKTGTVVGFARDEDEAIHLLVAMRPRDDGFSSLEWHAVGSVRISGATMHHLEEARKQLAEARASCEHHLTLNRSLNDLNCDLRRAVQARNETLAELAEVAWEHVPSAYRPVGLVAQARKQATNPIP